jgi:Helix-turn-helix domain
MSELRNRHAVDPIEMFGLLLDEIRVLRTLIEQRIPPAPPAREWLTADEASALALRSPQTITEWCRRYRIGVKVGSAWRVDRAHLRRLLTDRHGEARLPPGLR